MLLARVATLLAPSWLIAQWPLAVGELTLKRKQNVDYAAFDTTVLFNTAGLFSPAGLVPLLSRLDGHGRDDAWLVFGGMGPQVAPFGFPSFMVNVFPLGLWHNDALERA